MKVSDQLRTKHRSWHRLPYSLVCTECKRHFIGEHGHLFCGGCIRDVADLIVEAQKGLTHA